MKKLFEAKPPDTSIAKSREKRTLAELKRRHEYKKAGHKADFFLSSGSANSASVIEKPKGKQT
jgi:hypothetical protein